MESGCQIPASPSKESKMELINSRFCWGYVLMVVGCLIFMVSSASAQLSPRFETQAEQRDKNPAELGDNNKANIRSALRITKTTRQPMIEIILSSDRPFEGGNEVFALHIGKRTFFRSRYGDYDLHMLIFMLKPEEFAKTNTDDEIVVRYGGVSPDKDEGPRRSWKFGKLDKSKINK